MIKGKLKSNLNEFELAINELIGNQYDGVGISHYFDSLYDTFTRAKSCLEKEAAIFHKEIQFENFEDKQSILNSKENTAYPLLETLYESYFIVIHSELESLWQKVMQEYNNFHEQIISKDLNSKYLLERPRCFIDKAVLEHQIILTYNYIRNGVVHAKSDKFCQEFQNVERSIKSSQLIDLEIIDTEIGFRFSIHSLRFGEKYAYEILNLMQTIIHKSLEERQS